MIIIRPYHEFIHCPSANDILRRIELAGRTCYKSEDRIAPGSAEDFVRGIIRRGHLSVIEHVNITVRIVCDRAISHEIVRHRLAAYSQESTRYANYAGGQFGRQITVVLPLWYEDVLPTGVHTTAELAILENQLYDSARPEARRAALWLAAVTQAEACYLWMVKNGAAPQEARAVLPNSLKTEVVMTANLREWKHIFRVRCAKAAHPQMREIMRPMLADFYRRVPWVFEEEYREFIGERS